MPVSSPRSCPVLIERGAEVASLERLLAEAVGGRGRLALVTGEAGVGKSRLVRELVPLALGRGFRLLAGGCAERDRDYPFAPIVDALRQRLAEPGIDPRGLIEAQRETLAALLPEPSGSPPTGGPPPALGPEQEKRRRFEAVVAVLARLAADRPLLLVLEDLHWADPTSLELLELLPRRLATAPILLLTTARSDEFGDDLERCLAALRRARLLVEVSLERLSAQGVDAMLAALLPAPPPPALVAAIHARTDGNPFFVEEMLAAAPPDGADAWLPDRAFVPRTVRETVLRRVERLDERERAVIDLAAVVGRQIDLDLLLAASDLPRDEVVAALRVLLDRQLVVEERTVGRPRLSFRHALTREAVLDRVRGSRRRALHRAVGEALERDRTGSRASAGDLGYHFHAAEAWEPALAYAARAGKVAHAIHATAEALGHDRRALDAALALDHRRTGELHRRCGRALALLGAFEPAREHLEAALRFARERSDTDLEQAALDDLAGLYASRDYRTAERLAGEALALARARGDRRREGLALNRLGNILTNVLRFAEGRALHEEALVGFKALGDRWGTADALDLIGMARYLAGDVPEARRAFGQAAAIFVELDDTERAASALTSRGIYVAVLDGPCATDAGPAACRVDAERGLRLCREIGWRGGEAYSCVALACADLGDGRYGEARGHAETALAIAEEIGHRQWTVIASLTLGILHADLFDDARARERFEVALAVARAIGATQWERRLEAWLARCRLRAGEPRAAADLQALLPRTPHPATIHERRALASLAEWELAEERPERALALADRLLVGAAGPRAAEAVLLRAEALAASVRLDEADAAFHQARQLATRYGPRSLLWRVAAGRSRLWRTRDAALRADEAATARVELTAILEAIPEEAWRAAFLGAPSVHPWVTPTGRRRTADAVGVGGLTPRERDVTVAVAGGMSNKEIGAALSIAEKTVEMHVGSCLGKLGFASRTQLAGWAIGRGLAPAPEA